MPAPDSESVCIILNPGSGHQGGAPLDEAVQGHAGRNPRRIALRTLDESTDPAAAARQAVAEGYGTVVAAGGDGTISAVASVLAGSDRSMGILPLGTFNFFARGLGVPLEIEAALRVMDEGHVRAIAVGDVNGRIFLNNASLGIYPAILARREAVYRRWGRSRLAAYWSVLSTLLGFRRGRRLQVTVDGTPRRRRTPMVFVALSAYQLDQYGIEGGEGIRDGNFAVLVAPDVGRAGLIAFAARMLLRSVRRGADFELLTGREVVVEGTSRRLVARDGERERMRGPLRFTLRKGALRVIVPTPRTGAAAPRAVT